MNAYIRLMRLDKPIGSLLLLWPTYWALFLSADGWPDLDILFIFTSGVFIMRTAGCVINDFADRKIDKHIVRTQQRPLATGEISSNSALVLFGLLLLIALGLVLQTNILTLKLSLIAVLLATLYPFTKRWTNLPQLVLGAAFGMSVPMAFSAQTGVVPLTAWLVFIATLVWTLIYDTFYAMADRDEDLKIGVKSTAILFAKYDQIIITLLQILLIIVLILIGNVFDLGLIYDFSLVIISFFMIYHQFLLKKRQKEEYFKAFLNNNFIGMTAFLGIFLSVIIKS
ncbi:MAG: 4-hydroxybenzoate octaprenyltransferase [Candidatus Thioglobus sp.]|jgi:4-hydroxybenzoate polyprenyltransferase|nr:4-hydroxybenzoate octaprenyltransferase [Candidatus Pseudothioglobus aerophilus]MBT3439402.1 4-hydroxybenzoate octaprenyltransferase [Gammaproteobacteria bacterium]MDO7600287.1 4-hydroxybenzoate octaprenyltransferase [SAR86 cluster bacterium]MDP0560595.1 4-hydroxybenzoate octaprenyltransferase [Candidatus Thioglobus sp.]MBT4587021.1 4-hydroxybenzoate octaprenyltransferase [Gammaproteobacteria bacterium]